MKLINKTEHSERRLVNRSYQLFTCISKKHLFDFLSNFLLNRKTFENKKQYS